MEHRSLVRRAALALAGAAVLAVILDGFGGRRSLDFAVIALLLGAAALFAAWRFAPAGRRAILDAPILVAPFALLLAAEAALGGIGRLPLLSTLLHASVQAWFLSLSLLVLLLFLLGSLHAAWATLAVRRAMAGLPPDPWADFDAGLDLLPRAMGLGLVGGGAILAASSILASLGLPHLLLGAGILGGALFWNFFTAAVLLEGLDGKLRFGEALGRGTVRSWALRKEWWKPVVAQMALLGAVVYVDASSMGGLSRTQGWSMNGFWTGGYASTSLWLGGHASAVGEACPAIWLLLSRMAFGVLAVAIKCEIAAALARAPGGPPAAPSVPPGPGDVAGGGAPR